MTSSRDVGDDLLSKLGELASSDREREASLQEAADLIRSYGNYR